MSHVHSSMGMGSMSMGDGVPTLFEMQQAYWAAVGAVVAFATLVNGINYFLCWHRLRAVAQGDPRPAKPKFFLLRANATVTAILREASHAALPTFTIRKITIRLPSFGRFILVATNIAVLMVLCFYKLDTQDRWQFENIGYRTGSICVAQLPLLFLLAGKNNIIGWLTGFSYEQLNWLHRWVARTLLLTTTIHMGYWFNDWAPFDFIGTKIRTDSITQHGLISWAILVWIVFSSTSPIRGWSYEFFVIQHIISFAVFLGFVYLHTPEEVHVYFWIPIGLFFFDRIIRLLRTLYINLAIFHPKQRNSGQMLDLWACKATFTPLSHNTTQITIENPPITWSPGQHMFLSCHSILPLQSHPFTVASIPSDGKMEFFVKSEAGGTKRFFNHALKHHGLPESTNGGNKPMSTVAIEGPYGCIRPLQQFDTVVLVAGSAGATYTIPLLRDILERHRTPNLAPTRKFGLLSRLSGAVTRRIRFVWVVKSKGQLSWFSDQLSRAMEDFESLSSANPLVQVEISVYVTCDASFTDEHKSTVHKLFETPTPVEVHEKAGLDVKEQQLTIQEISPQDSEKKGCGADGSCCCRKTIESEDVSTADPVCSCACGPSSVSSKDEERSLSPLGSGKVPQTARPFLHPRIAIFSGRPQCRNIIRKSLEQARGESAIVACGPQGLLHDIKESVVYLSDERAVHKGTGAQGIYLHTEAFGY